LRPHDVERLSAYLDRELSAADRAAVESHLRECPECSGRLGELAAIDAAVRALPVEGTPEGYFESLPSRVRGGLQATRPRIQFGRPWVLSAAAALLLAVLTPATLRQMRSPGTPPTDRPEEGGRAAGDFDEADGPPSARDSAGPLAGSRPEPRPRPRSVAPAPVATEPAGPPETRAGEGRLQAPPAPGTGSKRDRARTAPSEDETGPAGAGRDSAERSRAADAGGTSAARAAPDSSFARPPAVEDRAAAPTPAATPGLAASPGRKEEQRPAATAKAVEAQRQRMAAGGRLGAGEAGAEDEGVSPSQARYESLLARPVTSPEDARALREAWRAFSMDHPDGPWADEARVRMVEVGADAYRRGGDPQDLALVRRDAAQYLKLGPATQARRVLAVLASLR